jgi:hypothetical protein
MLLAKESLVRIDRLIGVAAAHVQADTKATTKLTAAVEDLRDRSGKVVAGLTTADDDEVRRSIVELAQLGDLARAAAEADQAALDYTRQQVIDAHHWIHRLKQKAVD